MLNGETMTLGFECFYLVVGGEGLCLYASLPLYMVGQHVIVLNSDKKDTVPVVIHSLELVHFLIHCNDKPNKTFMFTRLEFLDCVWNI